MPYAAASQQPPTASFGMRLCTQAPEMGYPAVLLKVFFSRTAAFLKGEEARPKVGASSKEKAYGFFT